MSRYFLRLAYDGTRYSGWQTQPGVDTVQQTLGDALSVLVKDHRGVTGCGRTDAGVHASKFYAHFETETEVPEEIVYKLNAILPLDIAVAECFAVDGNMHARFSATYREYAYYVHYLKNPFRNHYSAFHPVALDVERMNPAAARLIGCRDFSSFARSGAPTKTNLCDVRLARWERVEDGAVFRIGANRFLRNMVRAIVGTLAQVGEGKMSEDEFEAVVEAKDREAAGKSAYPQGLFLTDVKYPFHGEGER